MMVYIELVLSIHQPVYEKIVQSREDVLEIRANLGRMDTIPSDEQVILKAIGLYHSVIKTVREGMPERTQTTKIRMVVDITQLL